MRGRRGLPECDQEPAEVNLTPLIDIVFILLIFFLVTTSFTQDAGIAVQRPAASSAEPTTGDALLVAIDAAGEVWLDGRTLDLRRLPTEVRRLRADRPRTAVVIQADRATAVGLLVAAMDLLRQAGVRDIALAADPRGEGSR